MNSSLSTHEPQALDELLAEGERLFAQRDGSHDMRQAIAILRGYAALRSIGAKLPVACAERVVECMRVCVRSGFFPKSEFSFFHP